MEKYIGENGSYSLMKQINLEKVFKLILLEHPISRAKLAGLSGLNKATVSNLVDFLLQNGVIEEIGASKPEGGRPAILLDLKKDFGVFIGIEYNTISSTILITDIEGNVLQKSKMAGKLLGPEELVDETVKVVEQCNIQYKNTKNGVLGVCICMPNNYNHTTGKVEYLAGHADWKGFPVKERLSERLKDVFIFIEQAVAAATLGDIHFGGYDPMQHLAYLYGAWGLNLAMYVTGHIYDGYQGFSGRFGHTVVEANGRQCTCGNKGCLETYASVHALMNMLYPEDADRLTRDHPYRYEKFKEVLELSKQNDLRVRDALFELCRHLVIGIMNIINIYNPEQVCIGGFLSLVLDDDMIRFINEEVIKRLPEHFTRELKISRSQLGEYSAAFGCISFIRSNLIDILLTNEKKMLYLDALKNM